MALSATSKDKTHDYTALSGSSAVAVRARLLRAGVPCQLTVEAADQAFAAQYRVIVRDLAAVHIKQPRLGGAGMQFDPDPVGGRYEDGLHRRLEKAAVRTLYTLGTDEGEVVMTAKSGRGYVIDGISFDRSKVKAVMSAKGLVNLADGARASIEDRVPDGLLLGMDPEFVLMQEDDRLVYASEFMERGGVAGSDVVRYQGEVIHPIAELRPDPKPTPKEAVTELQKAMREASRLITNRSLSWRAGALPHTAFPLGGHIHFSGVPLGLSLLQALDNYVALPLVMLEDPRGSKRRPRYGFLGDFRRQPHGGFEYRTLPSFLISPLITKVSLYLAYLVARYSDRLLARPLSTERYHRAYYEGDKAVLMECIPGWHRDVSSLPEYKDYAREIELCLNYIEEGRTWDESRDIRKLWNIPL
ncbi:hypothetical protein [Paenibacillus sp. JCM 10914]|uniref:putative amidoligase domain-containing protein n=1 Tax=Paenibacillus sp. JCM 10914 TaxID=1236974 RepID=UPI00056446EA|nr:hypothetical protein [Paenibacillus sp. JCM 10914]